MKNMKGQFLEKIKNKNGITLIALIITIIVLLILAGVALATLTGQGNIIGNAENAVGKYNNSVAGEQQLLNEIEKYFQNYLEGGNPPEVDENGLAIENTTIKPDPNSDLQITIPPGFAPAILTTGTTQSLPRRRWKCSKYNASRPVAQHNSRANKSRNSNSRQCHNI